MQKRIKKVKIDMKGNHALGIDNLAGVDLSFGSGELILQSQSPLGFLPDEIICEMSTDSEGPGRFPCIVVYEDGSEAQALLHWECSTLRLQLS